jgi:hypothetical protein
MVVFLNTCSTVGVFALAKEVCNPSIRTTASQHAHNLARDVTSDSAAHAQESTGAHPAATPYGKGAPQSSGAAHPNDELAGEKTYPAEHADRMHGHGDADVMTSEAAHAPTEADVDRVNLTVHVQDVNILFEADMGAVADGQQRFLAGCDVAHRDQSDDQLTETSRDSKESLQAEENTDLAEAERPAGRLRLENEGLKRELEAKDSQLDALRAEHEDLRRQMEEKRGLVESLEAEKTDLNEELEAKENILISLREENEALNTELEETRGFKDSLACTGTSEKGLAEGSDSRDSSADGSSNGRHAPVVGDDVAPWRNNNSSSQYAPESRTAGGDREEDRHALEKMTLEKEALEKDARDREALEKELLERQEALEVECQRLLDENEDLSSEVKRLGEERTKMLRDAALLTEEIADLKAESAQLKGEVDKLQNEMHAVVGQRDAVAAASERLSAEIVDLKVNDELIVYVSVSMLAVARLCAGFFLAVLFHLLRAHVYSCRSYTCRGTKECERPQRLCGFIHGVCVLGSVPLK